MGYADAHVEQPIDYQLSYVFIGDSVIAPEAVPAKEFKRLPQSSSFGVNVGTYWIKLELASSKSNGDLMGFVPTHNVDHMSLYRSVDEELVYIGETGNFVPKEELAYDYRYPAFQFDASDKTETYYLQVKFSKGANFPFRIEPKTLFESNKVYRYIGFSFFYGISLVVLLIHIFYFFKFKDPYYLYYFGFLFTLMFNLLMFDGTLLHFFRPFVWGGKVELVFHVIEEIFLLAFSIHFLGLKQKLPKFVKIAYAFPVLLAIAYFVFSFTGHFVIVAWADTLGICTFLVLWIIGFYYWKSDAYTRFYVIGYLILMPLGLYYFIGYSFGMWPVSGDDSIVKIGSAIDMLIFTFAITYRMKKVGLEKEVRIEELKAEIDTIKSSSREEEYNFYVFLKEHEYTNDTLTLKEIEILQLICEGYTNKEITERNHTSLSTVKTHCNKIFQKFDVGSREAVRNKIGYK